MVIDVHGPVHYKNGTQELIDSALYSERIYRKYHKRFLSVPFEAYDSFMRREDDYA